MPIGDSMINSAQVTNAGTMFPTSMPAAPKEPGKFSRIFGAIAGTALNFVAPGAGGLIGNLIGGGGIGGYANMEAMMQRQQQQSMMMLAVQNRVQTQTQEFTTVSNLLKAKHDGEMSAVHNFKS